MFPSCATPALQRGHFGVVVRSEFGPPQLLQMVHQATVDDLKARWTLDVPQSNFDNSKFQLCESHCNQPSDAGGMVEVDMDGMAGALLLRDWPRPCEQGEATRTHRNKKALCVCTYDVCMHVCMCVNREDSNASLFEQYVELKIVGPSHSRTSCSYPFW